MLRNVDTIDRSQQKLFRPAVSSDYIERGSFERGLHRADAPPILVVTAPAGYGKSSLVSHWVDRMNLSYTWVSIDEKDNDIRVLLQILALGLRDHSPSASEHLVHFCNSQDLPPLEVIAQLLSTDLAEIARPHALVFDDYHNISNMDIHDFVNELLVHRPTTLRFGLVSRSEPPVRLGRLRSLGLITDVRLGDLQFDRESESAFVAAATGSEVDVHHLDKLHAVTEGWPVGLRLLLLACQDKDDISEYLEQLQGSVWQIQDYLTEECLRDLPEDVANSVLRTSVLRRFSVDLCNAILDAGDGQISAGREVVDLFLNRNLFCIPLDESGRWFRHHHLFQDLLLNILNNEYSDSEIRSLHHRAAAWYDENESPEEAIYHYLQADEATLAGTVVSRHGEILKDLQDWHRLGQLLNTITKETVESNVDLMLLQAWVSDKAGRIEQMIELTERAEEMYRIELESKGENRIRLGQICAIRSTIELHLADRQTALDSARFALEALPVEFDFDRSVARFIEGYALQTLGDSPAGMTLLRAALQNQRNDNFRARIFYAMCFLHWASGDLAGLSHHSKACRELGKDGRLQETFCWASWFGGAANYQLNDLEAAESVIREVTEDPWPSEFIAHAICVHMRALIYAAKGDLKSASGLATTLIDKCLSMHSTSYLPDAQALQAELTFAGGEVASAARWALEEDFHSPILGYMFAAPGLTAARILLRSESDEGMQKADDILLEYEGFYESTHNTRFLIETLALRALWFARKNDTESAVKILERAICLAEPCGYVRLFVDIGPDLISLLSRLKLGERQLTYVGRIIQASHKTTGSESDGRDSKMHRHETSLTEILSKREYEVLALLAQDLTNKDIGERLFISPATVKRHTQNIYAKLSVSSRRAAAAKAVGLGLISD